MGFLDWCFHGVKVEPSGSLTSNLLMLSRWVAATLAIMDFFEEFREEMEAAERVEKIYAAAQLHPDQVPADWCYPDLSFGFNIWDNSSEAQITYAAMKALDSVALYDLVTLCPDGFPQQPNYNYNFNKFYRVDSYFEQMVYSPAKKESKRRYAVIGDYDDLVHEIIDEIAENNHPVAQMLAQLHLEYGSDYPPEVMDEVTTTVIVLTHWNGLRERLSRRVEAWRSAKAD